MWLQWFLDIHSKYLLKIGLSNTAEGSLFHQEFMRFPHVVATCQSYIDWDPLESCMENYVPTLTKMKYYSTLDKFL